MAPNSNREQFREQLQEIVNTGKEILSEHGAAATTQYVSQRVAENDDAEAINLRGEALFGIARDSFYDEAIDFGATIQLTDELPASVQWANTLADTGKYLSREERFTHRAEVVLGRAASMFETVYLAMRETGAPLDRRAQILIEDYCRVAGLQDEAGDKEGMRRTAQTIAPHLMALTIEINDDEAAYDRTTLESELSSMVHILGLENDNAREMFKHIRNERFREMTLSLLQERFASNLIAVGEVDRALAVLSASNGAPLNCWSRAYELWRNGEREVVLRLIEGIEEKFPDYYRQCGNVVVGLTPMTEILIAAQRDDLLTAAYQSAIDKDKDVSMLTKFAYQCGREGDQQRFEGVVESMTMEETHRARIYDALQQGQDDSRQAA